MASRKQQEGAQALSTFIAQLTATDHLPTHERNGEAERSAKEDALSISRLLNLRAELAFHEASVAMVHCHLGWARHAGAKHSSAIEAARERRDEVHLSLCRELIDSLSAVIASPARNKGEAKGKAVLINRYSAAVQGNMHAVSAWRAAAAAWGKAVECEVASFTPVAAREKQA